MSAKPEKWVWHEGGCHCGLVRWQVHESPDLQVVECNCSICAKSGFLHMLVGAKQFRLLQGEADLISYSFNTHRARHLFCKTCGVKSFYRPRSHPNGYSVNARCIDSNTIRSMHISQFDGRNWEQNIQNIPDVQE